MLLPKQIELKKHASMCHPPALVGCCGGAWRYATHTATRQNALPPVSKRGREAIACTRFPRRLQIALSVMPFFEIRVYPTKGDLLS
jgi:hypothetical protein